MRPASSNESVLAEVATITSESLDELEGVALEDVSGVALDDVAGDSLEELGCSFSLELEAMELLDTSSLLLDTTDELLSGNVTASLISYFCPLIVKVSLKVLACK